MSFIFNLSLPRAGTQSFHEAALRAGHKSAHFNEFENVQLYGDRKDQWLQFQENLNLYNVVSDVPIQWFVEELMSTYSDSKFVFVDRAIDGWVKSTKKLINCLRINRYDARPPIMLFSYLNKKYYENISDISEEDMVHAYKVYKRMVFDTAEKHSIHLETANLGDESFSQLTMRLFGTDAPLVDWAKNIQSTNNVRQSSP
jgi:hypothetical protein